MNLFLVCPHMRLFWYITEVLVPLARRPKQGAGRTQARRVCIYVFDPVARGGGAPEWPQGAVLPSSTTGWGRSHDLEFFCLLRSRLSFSGVSLSTVPVNSTVLFWYRVIKWNVTHNYLTLLLTGALYDVTVLYSRNYISTNGVITSMY